MELLALVLFGGLVALDGTSVGQLMISRPLVAATLAGWLLGDPVLGLLIGGLLELFYLVVVPTGGALFPEGGPAAVIAVVAGVTLPGPGGIALAVLMGLAWGQIGGVSIVLLRQVNARLAPAPELGAVTTADVTRTHLVGILLDFTRGCVLTTGGAILSIALGTALGAGIPGGWPFDGPGTTGLILLGAAAPLGMLLRTFIRDHRNLVLFALGLLGGVLMAVAS
jgi:mannose/fructose/N-acetylgalactosamine-specific phosphotransferase system component IIC